MPVKWLKPIRMRSSRKDYTRLLAGMRSSRKDRRMIKVMKEGKVIENVCPVCKSHLSVAIELLTGEAKLICVRCDSKRLNLPMPDVSQSCCGQQTKGED